MVRNKVCSVGEPFPLLMCAHAYNTHPNYYLDAYHAYSRE